MTFPKQLSASSVHKGLVVTFSVFLLLGCNESGSSRPLGATQVAATRSASGTALVSTGSTSTGPGWVLVYEDLTGPGYVSHIAEDSGRGLFVFGVAESSGQGIYQLDGDVTTLERGLNVPVTTSMPGDGKDAPLYVATTSPRTPGGGDVYVQTDTGWDLSLDGQQGGMVVGSYDELLYALSGEVGGGPAVNWLWDYTSRTWTRSSLGPCVPSACIWWQDQFWIGAGPNDPRGGSAKFLRGSGHSYVDYPVVLPGARPALNQRQTVTSFLGSCDHAPSVKGGEDHLIAALGVFDNATDTALRGQLVEFDADFLDQAPTLLLEFEGDVPVVLAGYTTNVFVGTQEGRLLQRHTQGWEQVPGAPANLGVHSLLMENSNTLLVGLRGRDGNAQLWRYRIASAGGE